MLSSLPYLVGALANGLDGLASDWLAVRLGLTRGRRTLGVLGLGIAALFMGATIFAPDGAWALAFLSIAYAGILMQQPNLCALCLDTGRQHAGAVFGFMNSAANGASAVSSIVFGYLAARTGNYNVPLLPMMALLCVGMWLWLKADPTHQLFRDELHATPHAVPAV
jgi:ACS family glucarate transporter-like MFS transporter